jgi:protease-4
LAYQTNNKMKDFLKMLLAVICGFIVMGFLGLMILGGLIGSAAGGSGKTVMPRNGVLVMDLSQFSIDEQAATPPTSLTSLVGGGVSLQAPISLWDAVQAIRKAAEDPSVKLIYMKPDGASLSSAISEEIRDALAEFRKSGKAVISYIESPTTGSYYLASVSDKVYMSSNCGAGPMMTGVSGQLFFLKDLLDKFGVNVQLIRHGKYKSAGEMYIKSEPSPENLEQNQAMVSSMANSMYEEISESRDVSVDSLNYLVDNMKLLFPEDMLNHGLVDGLLTKEELRQKLAVLAGADDFSNTGMVSFSDYVSSVITDPLKSKKQIAVIYAHGNIVEGSDPQNIGGDDFSTLLSMVRADSSVKAVVLRVSSPGGSVLAADKIKTEIDLLRKVKPVVASYGDYAASGGYWISASCDKIYTDKMTLTGSIGCFSMVPDLSKTAKDIAHVGIATVSSNKHGAMLTPFHTLDEAEVAVMQSQIENIYGKFVANVAEGRELSPAYVDSIAQGRVWTGADAIGINLADEIGSLSDAINYAATLAGEADASSIDVIGYPAPVTILDNILAMIGEGSSPVQDVFAGTPFWRVEEAFKSWKWQSSDHFMAMMPYQVIIK